MKIWLALFLTLSCVFAAETNAPVTSAGPKKVYVLPIRDNIMPPLVYLVRRGVKEAMEAKADVLILDMKTNGGRVDVTEEIIEIIGKFKGLTITYVNDRAFSAGAFISVGTQKIYMAPQSVIGAAAPIMMSPEGGVKDTPSTVEIKMTSAVRALVRRVAEKNGYNVEVVEAMIDKNKELIIDGKTLNKKGDILTLTDTEAAKEYGQPPKALLSSGTVESLEELLKKLGYAGAIRVNIQPTGAEKLGTWINAISPLLLIIGAIGIYLEFKSPGFGLPGIVGIAAFAIYFIGGYVAGFSGLEWMLIFLVGLVLLIVELFFFPGSIAIGLTGVALMLVAVVMALVDWYPSPAPAPGPGLPRLPRLPTLPQLELPLRQIMIAMLGTALGIWILSRLLPKTTLYGSLVSSSASGVVSVAAQNEQRAALLGQVGVTISNLRPGGKAQFGDRVLDVISQGDMVAKGQRVKITGHSGTEAIVEVV